MKAELIVITLLLCLMDNITYAERPINELPMYGGKHNPDVAPNKESSILAAKLGWEFYYKGDLDTAIKRFNQAWMFDRDNVDALWGFGLIMGRRAELEDPENNLNESIKYLQMANKRKNNSRIMVDLAYSEIMLGSFQKQNNKASFQEHFDKARIILQDAENLDNKNPLIYFNWSILEFYAGDYNNAKIRLNQAKKMGYSADPNFEKALNEKLNE